MKRHLLCVFTLVAVLLFGVGHADAAPKGKIVLGMAGSLTTFDPHVDSSFPISMHHPNVFDTLLARAPDGNLVTHLAKSYKLTSPTVWEFKLREGLKFSNGEPINAEAVKFSFERILNPKLKSRQYSYFKSVEKVEAAGTYTVRIHTKKPDPMLPPFLAIYGFIVPPKYYGSHDNAYLARHPVGSGPFVVKSWRKGQEVVYEANPNHWEPGVPKVKTAVVKFIPETTTRVSALASGDVDIIDNLPPAMAPQVKGSAGNRVIAKQSPRTNYILMVIGKGAPWDDVRVRRALNLAIDRESVIKNVLQGYAKEVPFVQGPVSFGYNPNLKPYPYDPEGAKKLLAEAGYAKGFEMKVMVPRGRFLMGEEALQAMAGQWARVGIKANVRIMQWGAMRNQIKSKWKKDVKPFLYYLARANTAFSAEHMFAGAIYSRSIYGGFRDKSVDAMIGKARQTLDDKKREMAYQKIAKFLHEEKVPLIPLWQEFRLFGVNKKIKWSPRADGKLIAAEVGLK